MVDLGLGTGRDPVCEGLGRLLRAGIDRDKLEIDRLLEGREVF